jgi:hypothetical protein
LLNSTVLTGAKVTSNFTIAVPATVITDSLRTQLTFQGDIYSRELQNLENSVRPLAHAVNVFSNPQTAPSQYKTDLANQLVRSLKIAFIGECDNGGFPANLSCAQPTRNTFLTAFNMRNSGPVINLPEFVKNISKSLDYLVGIQLADGSFPELGAYSLTNVWLNGPRLTAYVLYSILVTPVPLVAYKSAIDKAVQNLLLQASQLDSLTLTIFLRSLQELGHPNWNDIYKILDSKSSKSMLSKQWTQDLNKNEQAEMFVYILQAALVINDKASTLQISNWITTSLVDNYRNPLLYFKIGTFKALRQMIISYWTTNPQVLAVFAHVSSSREIVAVSPNNKQLLQAYQIPPVTRGVIIITLGTGFLNTKLTYQYNLETSEIKDQFELSINVVALAFISWQLNICVGYRSNGGQEMAAAAIMEIKFPGGFRTTDFVRDIDASSAKIKVNTKIVIPECP